MLRGNGSFRVSLGMRGSAVIGLIVVMSMFSGCGGGAGPLKPPGSLTWLGTLGGISSSATGVSADGSVVVGGSGGRAFRWTESYGMQDLGGVYAAGVSADGSVVVGGAFNSGINAAFRWTQSGGMQYLGTLTFYDEGYASGVSADGRVVVGSNSGFSYILPLTAVRWTVSNGIENLGGVYASGASADGRVVVGQAEDPFTSHRLAFRWDNDRSQFLGTLPGGDESWAKGVSAEGSVVVGQASNASGQNHAFRWENGVMQDLGTLPGGYEQSFASGVSNGGNVVVGYASKAGGQNRAFRWTSASGMQDLSIVYANLLNGSLLYSASSISPDGRFIVGYGHNKVTGRNEAFLLDTVAKRQ